MLMNLAIGVIAGTRLLKVCRILNGHRIFCLSATVGSFGIDVFVGEVTTALRRNSVNIPPKLNHWVALPTTDLVNLYPLPHMRTIHSQLRAACHTLPLFASRSISPPHSPIEN